MLHSRDTIIIYEKRTLRNLYVDVKISTLVILAFSFPQASIF